MPLGYGLFNPENGLFAFSPGFKGLISNWEDGTSVAIVGNTVAVGAPGIGEVTWYNLQTPVGLPSVWATRFGTMTVKTPEFPGGTTSVVIAGSGNPPVLGAGPGQGGTVGFVYVEENTTQDSDATIDGPWIDSTQNVPFSDFLPGMPVIGDVLKGGPYTIKSVDTNSNPNSLTLNTGSGVLTPSESNLSFGSLFFSSGLGTVVALQADGNAIAVAPFANNRGPATSAMAGPDGSPVEEFSVSDLYAPESAFSGTGVAGSIAVAGNQEIFGTPNSGSSVAVGDAVVYQSTSAVATLNPFKFVSQTDTEVDETAAVGFGIGAAPISEGFYLVGGTNTEAVNNGTSAADSGLLYDFRQRGPAWTPVAQTVTLNSFTENDTFTLQLSAAVVNGQNPITSGTAAPIPFSTTPATTANSIAAAMNNLIDTFSNLNGLQASVSLVSGQTFAISFTGTHANNVMPLTAKIVSSASGTVAAASDLVTTTQNPLAQAGSSVAISGNTFVAGAPTYNNSGAVFVYNYNAGTQQWVVQPLPLQPADVQADDHFGSSVALNGNTLVVGADNKTSGAGAVYLFQNVGGQWQQVAEFQGQAGAQLGTSAGVSGTEAIAGAPGSTTAYLYIFNGTAWTSQQTLTDTTDGSGSGFGSAVALDGGTAVVGAPSANNEGAAYVYVLNNGTWAQQGNNLGLLQSLSTGDGFGSAVAVSGGEIVVGAPDTKVAGSAGAGAAYLFKVDSSGTWSADGSALQNLLTLNPSDHFGASVAIDGQQVLVGAYGTGSDTGTAYIFSRNNGSWGLDSASGLLPGGAQAGDMVGYGVALSGSNAVLGAPQLNGRPAPAISTNGNGYAYIRSLSPPVTVTVPVRQQTLLQGAQTNEIVGTVGGMTTANLYFFDTPTVSLQTDAGTASTVTVGSAGLTAFGLLNFSVNNVGSGNDTLNVNSSTVGTPAGGSFAPALAFDPSSSTVTSDQITFPEADNLITGQLVEYHAGATNGVADSPIGGLTDGGDYYVTVVNPTTIELSLALGGPATADLDPSKATGSGHFFDTRVGELPINTPLGVADNKITFAQPDNLVGRQTVVYHAGSTAGSANTPIGGLTDGATYYVIAVNSTTIELSLTAGGTPITLDPSQATGTGQFLSAAVALQGVFSYGGTGTNTLSVHPNDAYWTLSSTGLTDPGGNQLQLANVTTVNLTGGTGTNTFTVDGWTGATVNLNGGSGSNTYNVYISGGAPNVNVTDPNGTGQLNIYGDPKRKNQFAVETNAVVCDEFQTISYTGISALTVTGQPLGDILQENDSSAATVVLTGVSGSDLFPVFQGTTANSQVIVHGSVPAGVTDTDELDLPTTAVATGTMNNSYDLNLDETLTFDPTVTIQPTISKVSSLPTRESSDTFTVPVTYGNPSGSMADDIASVALYVSVNGGAFILAQTRSTDPTESSGTVDFTFTGSDRNTYYFHSIATSVNGAVESKSSTLIEAATYVPDLNPPVTHVLAAGPAYAWSPFSASIFSGLTASSYSGGVFTLDWAGADPDQPAGGALALLSIYESIDGGTATLVGTVIPSSLTAVGYQGTTYYVYSGSMSCAALGDGQTHNYSFYSLGTDDQQMQQGVPSSADLTFTGVTYTTPLTAALTVEKGIQQRSYVRHLDVNFNQTLSSSTALQALASGLAGSQPAAFVELLWYGENLSAGSDRERYHRGRGFQ